MLRRFAVAQLRDPVVMETHGGYGRLWEACYAHLAHGIVFEKDSERASHLVLQRPSWAVYEADSEAALRLGAGAHLEVNLLDLDPYGDPWPTIAAFFASDRPRAPEMFVVVNDGLRMSARLRTAWHTGSLAPIVGKYGNDLGPVYLDVCEELMRENGAKAGYQLEAFSGYYCGHLGNMTHYLARLTLSPATDKSSKRTT